MENIPMRFFIGIILGLFFIASANAAELTLTSSAFSNNEKIPILYSCNGKNISPPLKWSNAPTNTQSFALIVSSPDWTTGKVYLWVLFNIPRDTNGLPEKANKDLPDGTIVGNNYYHDDDYAGPCPPDNLTHHYAFTLYALDTMLDLPSGAEIDDVFDKMEKHVIKQTTLTGVFSH